MPEVDCFFDIMGDKYDGVLLHRLDISQLILERTTQLSVQGTKGLVRGNTVSWFAIAVSLLYTCSRSWDTTSIST